MINVVSAFSNQFQNHVYCIFLGKLIICQFCFRCWRYVVNISHLSESVNIIVRLGNLMPHGFIINFLMCVATWCVLSFSCVPIYPLKCLSICLSTIASIRIKMYFDFKITENCHNILTFCWVQNIPQNFVKSCMYLLKGTRVNTF